MMVLYQVLQAYFGLTVNFGPKDGKFLIWSIDMKDIVVKYGMCIVYECCSDHMYFKMSAKSTHTWSPWFQCHLL